jgi:YjgF/chorismate_mutase-like, putative endoribonuclease
MAAGDSCAAKLASRLRQLGLILPNAPAPLGAYVTLSEVGSLLFLSGMLPVVDGKLPITGRPGENLSVEHAAVADVHQICSFNSLAPKMVNVRAVDGVQSLPIGTPAIIEVILEIN